MTQQFITVIEGVDYSQRKTANGYLEIKTGTLVNTLAAIQHKNDEGYELVLVPEERDHWPVAVGRQNIFYMRLKGDVNDLTECSDEGCPIPSTEQPEKEEKDDKNVSLSKVSVDELLEGPDWKTLEKLSKQALEDEADRWDIQIDPSNTKKVMLEDFQKAWSEKSQAV